MSNQTEVQRNNAITQDQPKKFIPNVRIPMSAPERAAVPVGPQIIKGIMREGNLSIIAAKPKEGKSNLARYAAVCIAKGVPFLERETHRSESLLISMEDPYMLTDESLETMGWDRDNDARIHIIEHMPNTSAACIEALRDVLTGLPNVKLVVIDTLQKLIQSEDLNDYSKTQGPIMALRNLVRNEFKHVHITALAHCKKTVTDNVFDSLLGSTAIRGEADTNIAIYQPGKKITGKEGQRVITTEVRWGRRIAPTFLNAELVSGSDESEMVKEFSLGSPLDEWEAQESSRKTEQQVNAFESQIIEHLQACGGSSPQADVLTAFRGNTAKKLDAIRKLEADGVIRGSEGKPKLITLNEGIALQLFAGMSNVN